MPLHQFKGRQSYNNTGGQKWQNAAVVLLIKKNCFNQDDVDANKAVILATTAATFEKVPTVRNTTAERWRQATANLSFPDSRVMFRL